MIGEPMRKSVLFLLISVLAGGWGSSLCWGQDRDGTPAPEATVVDGQARFQVLSPTLIRLEYAEEQEFEDQPSFFAINRDFPRASFETDVEDGWREIRTSELLLRYKQGSGPFHPENLVIRQREGEEPFVARPAWETQRPCRSGAVCEAERASEQRGTAVRKRQADYTGTGYVAFTAGEAQVRWTVEEAPPSGRYVLTLRYANETPNAALHLDVNGQRRGTTALAVTENWDKEWNAWGEVTDTVSLQAGQNTLSFTCATGSCRTYLDHLAIARPGDARPDPVPAPTPGNLGGWRHDLGNVREALPMHDGLLSRRGWYLLDDTEMALWKEENGWAEPRHRQASYRDGYFFGYGQDYKQALRDFKRLTGPPPLLPRWAFGIWFSRLHAYSASDYRQQLIPRFREHDVPLDVLIIDTDFKAPDRWKGWNWDRELFPDPEQFMAWTEQQGLKVALNVHPSISQNDPRFPEANRIGGGLDEATGDCPRWQSGDEPCSVWDWSKPKHADSYFSVHAPFEEEGVDFWWLDWCCDASRVTMPGLTPDSWTNHLYARRLRDQGKRGFVLSRIGASWQNRAGTEPGPWAEHRSSIHFTGDTYPTWEMLDYQISFTAREGNLGLPYVSHDIGSFHAGGPRADALPEDRYVRWVQFGAFQPIFRVHGHGHRVPWQYEDEAGAIAAQFMRLRHRLIPYLYTLARRAHDTGLPMARALYLEYPDHEVAYRFEDEYLLGPDLLVAPVARPGSVAAKTVWFPPGRWTDIFTGATYEGPQEKTFDVPLSLMPVFARDGTILPLQPQMDHVGQKPVDPLTLRIFAGADGRFKLYEDRGEGLGYKEGAYSWTTVRYEADAKRVVVSPPEGEGYDGQLDHRSVRFEISNVDRPTAVHVNGEAISQAPPTAKTGWRYEADRGRLIVRVTSHPTTEALTVEFQ